MFEKWNDKMRNTEKDDATLSSNFEKVVSISYLLRVYYVTVMDTYKYLFFYLKRINLRHYNLILLKININKQITLKEINKNLIILSNFFMYISFI